MVLVLRFNKISGGKKSILNNESYKVVHVVLREQFVSFLLTRSAVMPKLNFQMSNFRKQINTNNECVEQTLLEKVVPQSVFIKIEHKFLVALFLC